MKLHVTTESGSTETERGDDSSGLSDDNDMDLLLENERADIEKLQREFF